MTSEATAPSPSPDASPSPDRPPTWTYPTRTCRLCLEEVAPTVTLYPPGLPLAFQRPVVQYNNDDEYGRLMKPCLCRGGMRYIHELCLRRSRTESVRPGSLWKCHQCGYEFNFHRLTIERYLSSRFSSGVLTLLFMMIVVFFLGFVADPILNLYSDPYETIIGHEAVWQEVHVNQSDDKDSLTGWAQHFVKGLVSMGVLSFLRTMVLNPFQWWNLRNTGFVSSRVGGRSATGRDRAVNISWIVVVMGLLSASYVFYQWVQTIIGRTLQRIGNNIVDIQLPGDDDDLKPPPGFKFAESYPDVACPPAAASDPDPGKSGDESAPPSSSHDDPRHDRASEGFSLGNIDELPRRRRPMPGTWDHDALGQSWSFSGL